MIDENNEIHEVVGETIDTDDIEQNYQAPELITRSRAAALLGVTVATLDDWKYQGCTAIGEGVKLANVDLGSVMKWREDVLRAKVVREITKATAEEVSKPLEQLVRELRQTTGMDGNGKVSIEYAVNIFGFDPETVYEASERVGDMTVDPKSLRAFAVAHANSEGFRQGKSERFQAEDSTIVTLAYAAKVVGMEADQLNEYLDGSEDIVDSTPRGLSINLPKLIARMTGGMLQQALAQQAESLTQDHRRTAAEQRGQAVDSALEDARSQALSIALTGQQGTTPGERLMMAMAICGKLPAWLARDAGLAEFHVRMALDTVEAVEFSHAAIWAMLAGALEVNPQSLVGDETGGPIRANAVAPRERCDTVQEEG